MFIFRYIFGVCKHKKKTVAHYGPKIKLHTLVHIFAFYRRDDFISCGIYSVTALLSDRTDGHAYAGVVSVCRLSVTLCIVA